MDIRFDRFEVLQDASARRVRLVFVSPDPDPSPLDGNRYSEAAIELTDAQVSALAVPADPPTTAQTNAFWNLVTPELARVWRGSTVRTRLDPFKGAVRTV